VAMEEWQSQNIQMGVFSSGSIAAQKLLFKNSDFGNLTVYFKDYFDTTTGGKREFETYERIIEELHFKANSILFLSDIREELEAAEKAGMQTCQLVRPGTEINWKINVTSFEEIKVK
jgi:enolase-phosphatase E1